MPIMTYGGFKRMTSFCKTAIPQDISDTLESIKDNDEAVKVGVDIIKWLYGLHSCSVWLCFALLLM